MPSLVQLPDVARTKQSEYADVTSKRDCTTSTKKYHTSLDVQGSTVLVYCINFHFV